MSIAARSILLLLFPLACFGQLSPQARAIFQATAAAKPVQLVYSGTATLANMKMSIVNGTAFFDIVSGTALTNNIGGLLKIKDSGNHYLVGYIKAGGTGETYGSQLLANVDFENTTGLTPRLNGTLSSVAGGQTGNCLQMTGTSGNYAGFWEGFTTVNGGLYLGSVYGKDGTGSAFEHAMQQNFGAFNNIYHLWSQPANWTQQTYYRTTDGTAFLFYCYADATPGQYGLADTASAKQVLTPSTTGVTIVSTPGGSTYNWTSEDSGFIRYDQDGTGTYNIYIYK
jgi:hypothetical protein